MAGPVIQWRKLHASDEIRRSSQIIAVLGNDKLGVFSGELQPRQPVDNCVYQVTQNAVQKSEVTNAPSPRVGAASTTLNGATYIFSGRGGVEMTCIDEKGGLWCLEHSTLAWQFITPVNSAAQVPEPRSYHCMTSDGKNTIYVHAGCPASGRLHDLWAFDLTQRTWTQLPESPAPGRGGSSITYCKETSLLYRMNGFDGKKELGGQIDIYDSSNQSWSTHEFSDNGPEARSVSALVSLSINNKPYLITMFGERDPSSLGHAGAGKMLNDVWAFSVSDKKWSEMKAESGPCARGWFAAQAMGDDAVVLHGGLAEDNSRLGDVWVGTVGM